MIPLKLQLTNFLSYRERVEVDFTGLHLACISGQNGAGKSTLLDAMTWALFGKARRTDDAIIFSGANSSEVTFDFEYEGLIYRIQRIKSRTKTGTLDLFLQLIRDDGTIEWKPYTEKSITKTEERIVSILRMDYVTFTNASFFLQGRADQFSQQNSTERKKILASILGLDIWDVYNKKAAEKRKVLESDLLLIDSRMADINLELSEEGIRKEKFAELERSLKSFASRKKNQEDALNNIRLLDNLLKEQKKQLDVLQNHAASKRRSYDQIARLLEERRTEHTGMQQLLIREDEIIRKYAEWKSIRDRLETMNSLAMQFHDLREKRNTPYLTIEKTKNALEQELKALNDKKALVETILKELPEKRSGLDQDRSAISALEKQISQKTEIEMELSALRLQKEDVSVENKRLRAEMDQLDIRRKHLQTMQEPICPTCGQDLTDEHRSTLVDEISDQGKTLGDLYRENHKQISDLESRQLKLEDDLKLISRLENEKNILERKTDLVQAWINDREPDIKLWTETGHFRLEEIEAVLTTNTYAQNEKVEINQIDQQIAQLHYDSEAHEKLRKQESLLKTIEDEYQQLERTRSAIVPLERQIADIEKQLTEAQIELNDLNKNSEDAAKEYAEKSIGKPDLASAEVEFRKLIEEENVLRDETAAARQRVEVLDTLRNRKKDLDQERESTGRVIGQYKQLERAFGKDGVPALLIEQALPDIEAEANDLLDRLTAGEMSVRFSTQRDYKDKNREDKKETLDIQISDATGVRDYEMFSGGEAFRVNFAIRLALSRVLAQRAGARLQTLVIDEGFGSQDAIGRQRLQEAIHMVQNDFARILVITHLEELKDAFPSRIEVEKTSSGSAVTVIPGT